MSQPRARRWSHREHELLLEIRRRLATEIAACGQFPEVVGDRGLIRFLRGHGHDMEKVTEMYRNYLRWRKENNVDAVRQDIIQNGKTPREFPYAYDFLERTGNQILMSHGMRDLMGNPIAVETYEYSPKTILAGRTIEMYTQYMIYSMEYKMLIVEQLSEIEERRYLAGCNYNPPDRADGYGVLYQVTILRDLAGMSMEFMGTDSKALLKVSLEIAQNNYPEMLYKSHLVNTGWVFSTIWYFVKGLLDIRTAAKVTMTNSSDIPRALQDEVPVESIPTFIKGGKYDFSKEAPFQFDLSEFGPMHLFPTDGSKPSCYLEYYQMKNAPPPPSVTVVAVPNGTATTVAPIGQVAVHSLISEAGKGGIDHARRRSSGGFEKVRGVILDLDGTLLDTETISEKAIKTILSRIVLNGASPELPVSLKLQIMGLPDAAWTELIVSSLGLQEMLSPTDLLSQWEGMMEVLMNEVRPLPGAVELIERLWVLGIPLAIATSSSQKVVALKRAACPEIFEKVSVIVCGDDPDVLHGKPKPDIFLVAAQRINVPPFHCLVVEDSATGVAAGKAAGMRVCASVRPPISASLQDPTPEALKTYNDRIECQLSEDDSLVGGLEHFEFVKFGLFASSV